MNLAENRVPSVCDVVGCYQAPAFRAEIVIYAAVAYLHPPAIGALPVCVCAAHADETHARELLPDSGKREIEAGFLGAGRMKPDWKRSFVRWVAL